MAAQIGFVLMTHTQPEQVAYLCKRLSEMFGNPPIAIHHDYGQSPLNPASLPSQVRLVKDWVPTAWGKPVLLDAYLKALNLLYESASPDWAVCLSGADYPIRSAERILSDLRDTKADAWLDFREISEGCVQPEDANSIVTNFKTEKWMKTARDRYMAFDLIPFRIRKHIGMRNRTVFARHPVLTRLFTPFSPKFRPFAGDFWHTINRRAAEVLLDDTEQSRALRRFYQKRRPIPDESYFQTILLNSPKLTVENNNRRYAIWLENTSSPRPIGRADIPDMLASEAHFARKFPLDPELYKEVDSSIF